MQKTLGGDRLGAGNRMKVQLHNYERSTHDMGYLWRSTMSAGTLVPFMKTLALPGDTFDIDLDVDIKTHPTIGPLFGSYKVQLDVFVAPIRLYIAELHNNRLGIGMNMAAVKLPQVRLWAREALTEYHDLDNSQINPSCIFKYLGISGVGTNLSGDVASRDFNAVPWLAYWEIYKNYYANKQEEIGAVIHTQVETFIQDITQVEISLNVSSVAGPIEEQGDPDAGNEPMAHGGSMIFTAATLPRANTIMLNTVDGRRFSVEDLQQGPIVAAGGGTYFTRYNGKYGQITIDSWQYIQPEEMQVGPPIVVNFPLGGIDGMKDIILTNPVGTPLVIAGASNEPYVFAITETNGFRHTLGTQEGLAVKTYQSDLFNNWLQTEWIDGVGGIADVTAIDTTGGSFTIDTLNLSKKVYDMLNRIAVSGGSYSDWLDAVYTENNFRQVESPIYVGGLIRELVFQEVIANAESADQALGTLAGRGIMAGKKKGGKIVVKCNEPSYIIGIISLTPRIDYSQGNEWDTHLETMDDLHKPALDQIGFQELITEQMAWWATSRTLTEWVTTSAGKQPAWINYMTNVNKCYGNFAIAQNEMFMTLNRRYEHGGDFVTIGDLTTYIDPVKFNNIFAETSLDAMNFWAQISVDMIARRKMSAKLMPNL